MKSYKNKYILVTGAAGFIGFHLCLKFLNNGYNVVGLDNINSYYNKKLKYDRLKELKKFKKKFIFFKIDLKKKKELKKVFSNYKIFKVYHMAAQAGVRKSVKFPKTYIDNNILVTTNLFEEIKNFKSLPIIIASSSSIYGNQNSEIFSTKQKTDTPIQMYAVSKKCTELIAYSYSHQYNIPVICLRFFTVYGPWGRPDMALYKFTHKIYNKKTIEVFNNGNHFRDFTYIDDIINGIDIVSKNLDKKKLEKYSVFNLGNGKPTSLLKFIKIIEKETKIKAKLQYKPQQQGDMVSTHADMRLFKKKFRVKQNTKLKDGIKIFLKWYKKYYKINEN